MKKRTFILAFTFLFFISFLSIRCSKKENPSQKITSSTKGFSQEIHLSSEVLSTLDLQTEVVQRKTLFREIKASGKVVQDTNKATFVFSSSSGIVEKIYIKVGETVEAKQSLLQVGKTLLRAPKKGTVISVNTSLGVKVSILDALVTLAEIDTIRVVFDVYPKDMDQIALEQKVEVTLIGHGKEIFPGVVHYISPNLEEASQTLKVGVDVQNRGHHLKFGMFVQGRILTHQEKKILVVPEEAVVHLGEDSVVFIPHGDGVFFKKPVKIGQQEKGVVEILEGLKEGEKVVTQGSFTLKAESLKRSLKGS